ncbi:DUF4124 domain-containing protein [Ramlibacter sp. XY19]|uniref:DUF4124 domain-containing protein n=1 Tax=Ramlibacter paludis TaxID=2908000 RepID=UPI0023D9F525|nr:DUF4124 domain-containing protein [Ramlibacter paludis]MCG2593536.1 DUF4124 domain-containing protein [Ramlibacter paludis]
MKALRLAVLALACTVPLLASAQWIYLDKSGRKVFSDQVPPPDVTPDRILRQPGMRPAAAPAAPAEAQAAAAPVAAGSAAKGAGTDKALEAKKKQAEAAEAAKKKEQDEKFAQARTENCTRARNSKAAFDSGVRVVRTNEKGEQEVLDDKQREAETRRLEALIARDCGPR